MVQEQSEEVQEPAVERPTPQGRQVVPACPEEAWVLQSAPAQGLESAALVLAAVALALAWPEQEAPLQQARAQEPAAVARESWKAPELAQVQAE